MTTKHSATEADLAGVPDNAKAEIVNGEIVLMAPSGPVPGRAAGFIFVSLIDYERRSGRGWAAIDNIGFVVDLPNRRSFSPDASYSFIPLPVDLKFARGAPIFAVEVRSDGDYGPAAERRMAAKREDYFAAGTEIVWDVDLLGEAVIRSYSRSNPASPTVFRRGEVADGEPHLPGWRFPVNNMFGVS